ncbi:MAG: hypothetical protein KAJ54_00035 [Candidatus Aenigmarchaeota archaeon]|nr:hypothetical protein [Candidatus Aenigmarchaeota archaeon]MCK5321738.1 hypothetical protein [Candidatus Aenigmarchaeota archaeon]
MDDSDIKKMVQKRLEGWDLDELSIRYEITPDEISKILKENMDLNDFFTINIDFKTKNPEIIKKRMYERLVEILTKIYAVYDVPSASQRFIIIDTPEKKIGIDIKVTYYDTVIKSAWKYKAYNEKVDELYIIIISSRVSGSYLKKLKDDPTLPENTTLISLEEKEEIQKLQDLLLNLKF